MQFERSVGVRVFLCIFKDISNSPNVADAFLVLYVFVSSFLILFFFVAFLNFSHCPNVAAAFLVAEPEFELKEKCAFSSSRDKLMDSLIEIQSLC